MFVPAAGSTEHTPTYTVYIQTPNGREIWLDGEGQSIQNRLLLIGAPTSTTDGEPLWLDGNSLKFDASAVQELPANTTLELELQYWVADQAGLQTASPAIAKLQISGVNDAPVLNAALEDQIAVQGEAFSFTVPADTFSDVDANTTLSYSATLANGSALPGWLSFAPQTGTFNGTPTSGDTGTVSIKVSASDGSLSANDTFNIIFPVTVALDAQNPAGTQQNPAQYDASSGAFRFTDDISTPDFFEITGFGADDSLSFLGEVDMETLAIGLDGSDVTFGYNAGGGVNSSVILKGVVDDDAFINDLTTFNALPIGNLFIPTPVIPA